jgi:hypothetical protein
MCTSSLTCVLAGTARFITYAVTGGDGQIGAQRPVFRFRIRLLRKLITDSD